MSPTIHRKYKHFHCTVLTAEGRGKKFHFCCSSLYQSRSQGPLSIAREEERGPWGGSSPPIKSQMI